MTNKLITVVSFIPVIDILFMSSLAYSLLRLVCIMYLSWCNHNTVYLYCQYAFSISGISGMYVCYILHWLFMQVSVCQNAYSVTLRIFGGRYRGYIRIILYLFKRIMSIIYILFLFLILILGALFNVTVT